MGPGATYNALVGHTARHGSCLFVSAKGDFMLIRLIVCLFVPLTAHATLARPEFSSPSGSENAVWFEHIYRTDIASLEHFQQMDEESRRLYISHYIQPLMKFLFGPSTHRSIGGPQRSEVIEVKWERAFLENEKVVLPFRYRGVWILEQRIAARGEFSLPVPYNYDALFTRGWKRCGDPDPEHATPGFFWYFWDPNRAGCDHVHGVHFQEVAIQIGVPTPNETATYPEYERMIRQNNGQAGLAITVAFGYVRDRENPDPDNDPDVGANEYRTFLKNVRRWHPWREEPIYMSEYKFSDQKNTIIGRRFTANIHGVPTTLNVVINAGIDQIILFAQSFAHDHEALFAWMGHSRVGDGFDADKFRGLMNWHPGYYSVSDQYQLVYWGGCNSYSYYTLPFFGFKAYTNPAQDPKGTRNLDIIAHGLPSYFILNGVNAEAVVHAVLAWPSRTSYQKILKRIDDNGDYAGIRILPAVLGDEDNPR